MWPVKQDSAPTASAMQGMVSVELVLTGISFLNLRIFGIFQDTVTMILLLQWCLLLHSSRKEEIWLRIILNERLI